ncbi:MAG: hypothetical protein K2K82_01585 [Muribaculaceae bacterium]|nr:hypothetical protein [Muribaculaceae bacterium]
MKKTLLLSAAAALLSASAVSAQSYKEGAYYTEGEAVSSVDGITSGLYFIKVHAKSGNNDKTFSRGEKLLYNYDGASTGNRAARLYTDLNVPEMGTSEATLLWNITVTDGEFNGEQCKLFSVQSVSEGTYWSIKALQGLTVDEVEYPSKGDMYDTNEESKIAQFHLVGLPDDYTYEGTVTGNTRFFVQLTNAQFYNKVDNQPEVIAYPFLHNNAQTPVCVSYWANANVNSTAIQLEFVKAVENIDVVDIQVNFPKFNMDDMSTTLTLDSAAGANDLKKAIDDYIADNGGMVNAVYPTITTVNAGDTYTVTGTWVNQLVPNHVYRLNIRPADNETNNAAVRYVRDDVETGVGAGDIGYILTRNGGPTSFNTIELERFWYFKEVQAPTETEGGVYTIHNLARPYDKGVYVANANNELCSLLEAQTEFQMMSSSEGSIRQPGDFAMVVNGTTTSYLNDVNGKLGLWTAAASRNDGGSLIRLTSLVEDDFNDFAQFAPSDLVEAAKADPTPENVLALYEHYTGRTLEAAIYAAKTYTIGDEVGQYNNADHNFAELLAAAEAVAADPSATEADKAAAAASISEYSLVVNMPTPGRFYRLRSVTGNKLLSSLPLTAGGNRLLAHEVPADGVETAGANTVFYLHQDEEGNLLLVSFADGKVISKFAQGNNNPWTFVVKGSAHAATNIQFGHRGKNGGFIVCVDKDNHRHIHNAGDNTIGCGTGANAGYQWEIIPVTSLPVPIFNLPADADSEDTPSFFFSIHSPVALENIDNVEAYTGSFTGTAVEKTKIEGVIPANTPVLLEYKGGVQHGDHGDYLFFPIVNEGVSTMAESATSTDINGDIFAFEKQADTHYYTLHETEMNRFRLHRVYAEAHDDVENNVVPGFKAHIAVPATEDPVEYFEIVDKDPSTAINEVETEGAVKAAKVYDLQGRKLAAPVKGINIINGQKVLVK